MGLLDPPAYSRTAADARFNRKGALGQNAREFLFSANLDTVDATAATLAVTGPYTTRTGNSYYASPNYLSWATLLAGNYIRFLGGTAGSNGGSAANVAQAGNPTPTFSPWMWEFTHYGDTVIELWFIKNSVSANTWMRVRVDGKLISTDATPVAGATADYKLMKATITFPTRRHRRIGVEMSGGCQIVGLNLDTDYGGSITATPAPTEQVVFLTDSYGDYPLSENVQFKSMPYVMARELRWGFPVVLAQGGTGFINAATGTKKTFINRLSDVAAFSPKILVVIGGYNDSDQAGGTPPTAAAITAAVKAFVEAVPTQVPTVQRLYIIGAQQPVPNGNLATVTTAIADGVSTANAGTLEVHHISPSGWVTGATSAPLAVPRQLPATVATTGGSFAAGTYYAKVTAVNSYGETTASNEVSATVALNGTITWEWSPSGGATSYTLYVGTAAGTYDRKLTGITTTKKTDDGTGTTGSYTPPGSNGSARNPATIGSARVFALPDWTHLTDEGAEHYGRMAANAIKSYLAV